MALSVEDRKAIVRQFQELDQKRASWKTLWQHISELTIPRKDAIFDNQKSPGEEQRQSSTIQPDYGRNLGKKHLG